MLVLQQMLIFLGFILIGIFLRHKRWINPDNQYQLTAIVVNVTTPAMLLAPDLSASFKNDLSELYFCGLVLLITQLLLIGCGIIMSRLLRCSKEERPAYNLMHVCTNVALIGIPLAGTVFGTRGMFYMSIFIIVNNVIFFAYGSWLLNSDGRFSLKSLKSSINPCVIASFLLLILFIAKIKLPYGISTFLHSLGNVSPPLSLMLIGASLYGVSIKLMLRDFRLMIFAFCKMVVLPILLLLLIKQFVSERELLGACFVVVATPSGVMTAMLITLLKPKLLPLATKGISLTSAMAVATMPLVSLVTGIT